eukprot:scaffold51374_cov30-Tisochrysis_lutea.AAC.2
MASISLRPHHHLAIKQVALASAVHVLGHRAKNGCRVLTTTLVIVAVFIPTERSHASHLNVTGVLGCH